LLFSRISFAQETSITDFNFHSAAARKEWDDLGSLAELVTPKATNRAEFTEECKSGALDGIVAVYRTFPSINTTGRVDEELVEALPKSLKYICHNGTFLFPASGWRLHGNGIGDPETRAHDIEIEALQSCHFLVFSSGISAALQCTSNLPITDVRLDSDVSDLLQTAGNRSFSVFSLSSFTSTKIIC